MVPFDEQSESPVAKKFVAAHRSAFGDVPIAFYTAYSYDAVRMMADAIKRANSTDRDKVMKALGDTKNFQGVTGNYSFNGKGDNASGSPFMVEIGSKGEQKSLK